LIDFEWLKQLKKFLGLTLIPRFWDRASMATPGRIDNRRLFKRDPTDPDELKEPLVKGKDYCLVPEEAWILLRYEFGLAPGQEPIARKVRL
jgi:hypothetical protein